MKLTKSVSREERKVSNGRKEICCMKFFMEHPNINDKFFLEAEGVGYDYASLNRQRGIRNESGLFFIIEGYRDAAYYLLDELLNNHKGDWLKIDSLIYPLLFSYRHYLEIVMKDTLRYHRLIKQETFFDQVGFKNEHSLIKIWTELKPYLEHIYVNAENLNEKFSAVEKLLNEIDEKDKGSYSFRYPFDSSRNLDTPIQFSLPHIAIDLGNLKAVFQKLSYYFDSINEHAKVLLDEMLRE